MQNARQMLKHHRDVLFGSGSTPCHALLLTGRILLCGRIIRCEPSLCSRSRGLRLLQLCHSCIGELQLPLRQYMRPRVLLLCCQIAHRQIVLQTQATQLTSQHVHSVFEHLRALWALCTHMCRLRLARRRSHACCMIQRVRRTRWSPIWSVNSTMRMELQCRLGHDFL